MTVPLDAQPTNRGQRAAVAVCLMLAGGCLVLAWIGAANPWNYLWVDRLFGISLLYVWASGLLVVVGVGVITRRAWLPVTILGLTVAVCVVMIGLQIWNHGPTRHEGGQVAEATAPDGHVSATAFSTWVDEQFWSVRLRTGSGLTTREEAVHTAIYSWGEARAPRLEFLDESTLVLTYEGCQAVIRFDPATLHIIEVEQFRQSDRGCMWGPDDNP